MTDTGKQIEIRNKALMVLQNILVDTGPNTIVQLYSRFRSRTRQPIVIEQVGSNPNQLLQTIALFPQYFTVKGKEISLRKLIKNNGNTGIGTQKYLQKEQALKKQEESEQVYKAQIIRDLKAIILLSPRKALKIKELYDRYMQIKNKGRLGLGTNLETFHASVTNLKDFHISNKKNVSVVCADNPLNTDVTPKTKKNQVADPSEEKAVVMQKQQNLQADDKQPALSEHLVVQSDSVQLVNNDLKIDTDMQKQLALQKPEEIENVYKAQIVSELKAIILLTATKYIHVEELYDRYMQIKNKGRLGLGTNLETFHISLKNLKDFHIGKKKKNVSVVCANNASTDVTPKTKKNQVADHSEEKAVVMQEQQKLQAEDKQLALSEHLVVVPDNVQLVDSSTSNVVATFLMMNKREYELPIIALHVEGFSKKKKFVITVLSIASWDGDVCVIEFSPKGSNSHLHVNEKESLKQLLEDKDILKVCHDCQTISKGLQEQFQIQLAYYVFDTQICYQIVNEKQVNRPQSTSFMELCQYMNMTLVEKPHIKKLWKGHPLTAEVLVYLKCSVNAMVPSIYLYMLQLLGTENIPRFSAACLDALRDKRTKNGSNTHETKQPSNAAIHNVPAEVLTNGYANELYGYSNTGASVDAPGDAVDVVERFSKIQLEPSPFKQGPSRTQMSKPLPLSKRAKVSPVPQSVKNTRLLQFDENSNAYFIPLHSETVQSVNPSNITQEMIASVNEKNERDMQLFLGVFPEEIQEALQSLHHQDSMCSLEFLVEVVLDTGRKPHARYYQPGTGNCVTQDLMDTALSAQQVDDVFSGNNFTEFTTDRRAGIEGTLHRVSNISNRQLKPIGLTARVGRAIFGCLDMIFDIVASGKSVLILGSPGVGKTTVLREFARVLSDVLEQRVMIVDTSNEIGGDGDSLHESLGSARRLQVHPRSEQYKFMIEAVQNHNPQVIIIDEMGTIQEAQAAQSIAERGVQLIATAHGQTCEDVHRNPSLRPIAGSAHSVILSKEEVISRKSETKTMLERQRDPSFDVLIELRERDRWLIHHNLSDSIDAHLRGGSPRVEVRERVQRTTADGSTYQEIRVSVCTTSTAMA